MYKSPGSILFHVEHAACGHHLDKDDSDLNSPKLPLPPQFLLTKDNSGLRVFKNLFKREGKGKRGNLAYPEKLMNQNCASPNPYVPPADPDVATCWNTSCDKQ